MKPTHKWAISHRERLWTLAEHSLQGRLPELSSEMRERGAGSDAEGLVCVRACRWEIARSREAAGVGRGRRAGVAWLPHL